MKKIFVAVLLLATANATADAQTTNDKTTHTVPLQVAPRIVLCDPAREGGDECAPPTARVPLPSAPGRRPFLSSPPQEFAQRLPDAYTPPRPAQFEKIDEARTHFRWGAAVRQSLLFLTVQHSYALTQPKTRRDLHGPFFKDYFRSVRSLHGWADGGRFFTNYIAHPMEGSLLGFIQVQNDPAGSRLRLGEPGYWRSRMKALAWSAAWSTQFEIGPISQASIGNVGLHGKQTYVDIVITPTVGTAMLLTEDALDRYLIERIERRTENRFVRIFSRMALNPTRTAANLLRLKKPWYRDAGLR